MAVLIIAETGVNHGGSLQKAKEMADAAKKAGADAVKYQIGVPELIVSRYAEKASYQKEMAGDEESQLEMLQELMLTFNEHRELKAHCDTIGIQYLGAAFDLASLDFLDSLDVPFYKIPSGEITNLPYLERVASFNKPVLLSTGMSNLAEIEDALSALEHAGAGDITLMHCNTAYPTPFEDANLLAITDLRNVFGLQVGYSDHTLGWVCPAAAVTLGAVAIEKHFTLDKEMDGPDHQASLDAGELWHMVQAVRQCELAMGEGQKIVTDSEQENIILTRKSIVAAEYIKAGTIFSKENITTKRPGDGISPMHWYEVLGRVAKKDFEEDERIDL